MYIQGKYLLAGLDDLSECFSIRREVFLEEQRFPTAAVEDEDDKTAIFAVAYETEQQKSAEQKSEQVKAVATGRLIFIDDYFKIGRIAVRKEYRGRKYGDFIVRMLVDKAFSMGAKEVFVGAQEHAIQFYKKIGFVELQDTYSEDGILHTVMKIMPCTCKKECQKK